MKPVIGTLKIRAVKRASSGQVRLGIDPEITGSIKLLMIIEWTIT